jgi:HPt (histidine-containing phosphotransfer) domain-containing protein
LSSRAEQITSEVKRLVLKCRKLEADLAQSVPKKVLDENVAKLQAKIDALNVELKHTKSDLETQRTINEHMDAFEKQLEAQGKEISSQNEIVKSVATRIDTMVPTGVYEEATAKIHALENALEARNQEYQTLQAQKAEVEERITHMVPEEQFESLQTELANSIPKIIYEQDIQRIHAETVPREQYASVESRIAELEIQLANSVPKAEFDELSETIVSLTKSAPVIDGEFATATAVAAN